MGFGVVLAPRLYLNGRKQPHFYGVAAGATEREDDHDPFLANTIQSVRVERPNIKEPCPVW